MAPSRSGCSLLPTPATIALHDLLASKIDPGTGVWRAVSDAAGRLIPERYRLQAEVMRQSTKSVGRGPSSF